MKKSLQITLLSALLSTTLGAQSLNLLERQLILFQGDSVLILTKAEAVDLGNFAKESFKTQSRLNAALLREQNYQRLWEYAAIDLTAQKAITASLRREVGARKEQVDLITEQHKNEKRRKFVQNTGIGIVIGI